MTSPVRLSISGKDPSSNEHTPSASCSLISCLWSCRCLKNRFSCLTLPSESESSFQSLAPTVCHCLPLPAGGPPGPDLLGFHLSPRVRHSPRLTFQTRLDQLLASKYGESNSNCKESESPEEAFHGSAWMSACFKW